MSVGINREDILRISGANPRLCMKCGKCSGACPSFDEMEFHPHQFAYMVLDGDIAPLINSNAMYKCLSCFVCSERCPKEVHPSKLVEAIRLAVIRQQGKNYIKPDQIPGLLDDQIPQQAIVSAMRKYAK